MTMFGIGLITLAVSGVLTAIAVARSGRLSRYAGWLFAIGYILFLPQFFGPPAVRIGHGVLLGIGLVWLAIALWRATKSVGRRQPVAAGPTLEDRAVPRS
jgi:threonine/homoserine/homoserine lactone efflux protein